MLISIRRRHFEQVKVAVRIVLNVLKAVSLEPNDENPVLKDLFGRALSIASSIHAVCTKLVQYFTSSYAYFQDFVKSPQILSYFELYSDPLNRKVM